MDGIGRAQTVGVIMPVHDGAATIVRAIAAIRRSHRQVDAVLVVDDASRDQSGAMAAALGAIVHRTGDTPIGPGMARNQGVALLDTDIVLFIDSDVEVHADAIGLLLQAFDAPEVSAAFGSYDDRPESRAWPALYANLRHHYIHQNGARAAGTFWAGLGAVRRTAFVALDGFSVVYGRPSIEDVELGIRLRAAGHGIALIRVAQGKHLKDWRLLQLWRTDIWQRAAPWSRLIALGVGPADELNLAPAQRISALLALMIAVAGISALWWTPAMLVALLATVAWTWLNIGLFRLFRQSGRGALLTGAMLHWIYFLYSSVTYALVRADHAVRAGKQRKRR